ncbi:MAG: 4-hydroxybenzoate octaprenyltransferase [Methylotenera sp.]|nr:4-hydroxybenzoate octaprenyltransferase [Methylotenera sp.]MDO9233781.1 4-hydroxybenzoate octaprenyltransferase [Methylotenera sp.]MDO9388219.1 4-hydroxybenzoate octaprenyltransferase [Methylotenera sp.]MDP2101990.1 4-hydroxybenzoate octaprenyltransferase [Methylotenera sp.]MDP2282018.1 4-hydroxybenzoate octaprenyltransferase [Methylotenera sp.]
MNIADLTKKIDAYERLMRLDKPIGILLLLWPTLWALLIAGNGNPDWIVVMIFVTGTALMRSAGCVMNDIADSQYDGLVERTQYRPIPNGEISKKEAYVLAAILSLVAFGLVNLLNMLTVKLSVLALFLAITYPLTKRFFVMPQAYLGVAFGFGIPMAFAATSNNIPPVAWLLLLANVFWAIAYDTEYAMVDREDDLKIGIRSSAITFGRFDVLAVMLCYAMTLALLALAGYWLLMGVAYYIGLTVAAAIALYHYFLIKNRARANCFQAFLGNNWLGLAVFAGLATHYLIQLR